MTKVTEYRWQGRGGTGVKAANITPKTGSIVGGFVLTGGEKGDLICMSKHGQTIRLGIADIPERSRATQGVIIMRLDAGDKVASISLVLEEVAELPKAEVQKALVMAKKEEAVLQKELALEGVTLEGEELPAKEAAKVESPKKAPVAKKTVKKAPTAKKAPPKKKPAKPAKKKGGKKK